MAVNIPEKPKGKEPQYQKRGLRVNYPIIFLSGLLILIGGILVFLLIVRNVYGNYEISEILPTRENLENLAYEDKAALLYPQYTENKFEAGNTWVQDNIDTWKSYLSIIHMNYDIISDLDIELGKHFDYKVLILAGAQSLSDKQIIQIKKFLDRGGSVFATGGTASYSDEGKWRGWNFFTEVYGLKFNKEIKAEEKYKVHTLRGNLPITAGIPTGYALQIATWDRPICAEILEPRTEQVSFWYDYRKEAGLVREQIEQSAGIAFGTYGKGRFVWYGFQLNSVIGKQEDYINFEKLIRNSMNWLTYNPTSFVKDWPTPYEAAMIIVPTINDRPQNINNLIQTLKHNGRNTTYFWDTEQAIANPKLLQRVASIGDLGVIMDIGYIEDLADTSSRLYDKDVQYSSLDFARDTIYSITNKEVIGLMPLYGYYDENTIRTMLELNYNILITDSLTDRSVPKIEIRDNKELFVITKTARDDIEVIGKYGLTNIDYQRYTYEEDIDRLLIEGGLYVLKVHSNYQMKAEYVSVIKDIYEYVRNKNVWVTTIPELLSWWKKKSGLEVRYETRSKRRITVEVSNPKKFDMKDFIVQVNLNKPVKNIQISSDIISPFFEIKLPEHEFDTNTNILYLYIDELEAGETRTYLVDFENVSA